jgi:hypothetical protein
MLTSTLSWDHAPFLGGIACNLELTRDMAKPELIAAMVRSYAGRGMELQINVVNEETLLDAKAHPERHRNLVVRVGGYSDYFVTLNEKLQDEIISRSRESWKHYLTISGRTLPKIHSLSRCLRKFRWTACRYTSGSAASLPTERCTV